MTIFRLSTIRFSISLILSFRMESDAKINQYVKERKDSSILHEFLSVE
jgi:hypothetical protein